MRLFTHKQIKCRKQGDIVKRTQKQMNEIYKHTQTISLQQQRAGALLHRGALVHPGALLRPGAAAHRRAAPRALLLGPSAQTGA